MIESKTLYIPFFEEKKTKFNVMVVAAVGNIDTSGITMLGEVKKLMERRGLKVPQIYF